MEKETKKFSFSFYFYFYLFTVIRAVYFTIRIIVSTDIIYYYLYRLFNEDIAQSVGNASIMSNIGHSDCSQTLFWRCALPVPSS